LKKEKTKTEKNKKGKLFHPVAGAARPKSNATKEGCCAVGYVFMAEFFGRAKCDCFCVQPPNFASFFL